MAFNIIELKQSTPNYESPYKSLYVAHFQVDTEADLPAQEQSTYIIELGSTAHVVDTNSEYAIKSNGTWVLQYEGTAAYTKAEIDALLDDKQDELTFDASPTSGSQNPVYSGGVFTALQDKITADDVYGLGTAIANGDDLNSDAYKITGLYYANSATIAQSLSNAPASLTRPFRMEVTTLNSSSRYVQKIVEALLTGETVIYYRSYVSISNVPQWGQWYKFNGVAD